MLDMNRLIPSHDIVLLTMDTLRYDVACQQMADSNLPVLSRFFKKWQKRHSPGSFTYAAHQAIFAGFFPTPAVEPTAPRLMAVEFIGSQSLSPQTKVFNAPTIVEGLANEGYRTLCIGGVGFFNQQNPLGCVMPDLFQQAYWSADVGVTDPNSTSNQVAKAAEFIDAEPQQQPVFLFINISAIHQPNYFYRDQSASPGNNHDDLESHAAALRYVDGQLAPLFELFGKRRDTLFIICSDHGTCYGDQGFTGHRLAHQAVWTVPYAEFIQEKKS